MLLVYTGIVLCVFTAGFLGCASQFGARTKGAGLQRIHSSEHFKDGKFVNMEETALMSKDTSSFRSAIEWMKGTDNAVPQRPLPSEKFDEERFLKQTENIGLTWFGHSTVLLNIDGHIILTD
ncbi:MAG: hypothetical protein ACRCUT_14555, partial [Spirochaetota bacterium]